MMNRVNGSTAIAIAALLMATPALAQSKSDQTFVKKAIEGNLAEVQMGKLAQQKGASDNVRNFGQMLENDHAQNNQQATAVARQLNVTPPSGPNAEQKRTYDRLSKLSGAQFDREFAKAMVSDHKKHIKEFQSEAKSKNAQVADYAKGTLPHLQQHLQAAESLTQTAQAPRGAQPMQH
jgi:putative membrane protein